MSTVEIMALVGGIAWASGINLYATIFVLGLLARQGYMVLPEQLMILTDPMVLSAAGFMFFTEFIIDKVPGLDSIWDSMHTFIRIPAGALLAMSTVAGYDPVIELTAFLLGGTLAASTHLTKTSTRLMIQPSPEPFSNWTASLGEDLLVVVGIWTALAHPLIFLIALALFIAIVALLLPRIFRTGRHIFQYFKRTLNDDTADQIK